MNHNPRSRFHHVPDGRSLPAPSCSCTAKGFQTILGNHAFKVRRARLGTSTIAFVTGDHGWLVWRNTLQMKGQASGMSDSATTAETYLFVAREEQPRGLYNLR